jgi:Tfp pilus assembly protein PilF
VQHVGLRKACLGTLERLEQNNTMKTILTLLIALCPFVSFAQNLTEGSKPQLSIDQWHDQTKTNSQLLPKYGPIQKTEAQKSADQAFVADALKLDTSRRTASDDYIRLGFNYLYHDIKTAMYRFNQAYLLDSTNTDIYWGFGGVYMALGDYTNAEKQYLEGLALNSKNTHLLTDYGTYFLAQYYALLSLDEQSAKTNLDAAISYMGKSYNIDPDDQNTSYKLSICYWNKGDCNKAWQYYNICKKLGGQAITDDYTQDLTNKCKQN